MKKENNFLLLAKGRKTCYEFSNKGISNSDLNKILESARWAPSFSNLQPWRFIITKEKTMISKIMKKVSYGAFHTDPPLIISLVLPGSTTLGAYRGAKENKTGIIEGNLSVAFAASNIIYEAQELGISSAILTIDNDYLINCLKINKKDFIPLVISLGYEKKGAFQKKRERKSVSELKYKK